MSAQIKRPLVIKLACPALLLLLSFKPGNSPAGANSDSIRKELKVEGNFTNIRIDGNISVVLTNEPVGSVVIAGNEKSLNKVHHTLSHDTLFINDHRQFSFSKLTIYLSALNLEALRVNGDTNISSEDFIRSKHLHMSLNGNISVKVKTLGKLSFDSPEEIELQKKSATNVRGKEEGTVD